MLGSTKLESSFAEKELRVLVDTKLSMSQKCALATKKGQDILDCLRQQLKGGDLSNLFSTGGAMPGVVGPVLECLLQETHKATCRESSKGP